MRILIVEDEAMIRRGLANLIGKHTEHLVIGEAKNGEEGLRMAKELQPDLVITDIRMPKMSGLEMIRELYQENQPVHCVILSGYSEFDYAKQAIKYGVDDYLIKPLAPEDVTSLLEDIREKISTDLVRQSGTPEKMLKDFFLESVKDETRERELAGLCALNRGRIHMITAYMGKTRQEDRDECLQRFLKVKADNEPFALYCFFLERTREFIAILEDRHRKEILSQVEDRMMRNPLFHQEWVWTASAADSLGGLMEKYQRVNELYLYGMVLDPCVIITEERVQAFRPEPFQYPSNIEHQLQTGIFSGDKKAVESGGNEFMEKMRKAVIMPDQIKEAYMKMSNFLLGIYQDNDKTVYEKLQSLKPMKNVELAFTYKELEGIFREEIRVVSSMLNHKEDISNYNIKRAIEYIRNHFNENISLETVAGKLDITPEYLSTLFNREVGENFSVFIKRFRISQAKRLLRMTDKKIYEIAAEVGYPDSKYFNRVFKDEMGMSPGDYRALN